MLRIQAKKGLIMREEFDRVEVEQLSEWMSKKTRSCDPVTKAMYM